MSDPASVRAAVTALSAGSAPIDILVNNAGIARLGSLLTISDKDWRDTFAVNVDGVFNVTRAVVPGMVERKRGAVGEPRHPGSAGAVIPPSAPTRQAAEFAVVGMTQSLRRRAAAPFGVRVDAGCPGLIGGDAHARRARQDLGGGRPAACRASGGEVGSLGRVGTPEDVAKVVAFLASDEAAYVTGACYDVAGGLWMT